MRPAFEKNWQKIFIDGDLLCKFRAKFGCVPLRCRSSCKCGFVDTLASNWKFDRKCRLLLEFDWYEIRNFGKFLMYIANCFCGIVAYEEYLRFFLAIKAPEVFYCYCMFGRKKKHFLRKFSLAVECLVKKQQVNILRFL